MKLYIGNKNYSSWSMRPWLVLQHFGIPFDEKLIPFDEFKADQPFKMKMTQISPTGKVPTLVDEDFVIWDSLAICEYLAEQNPAKPLWPLGIQQRTEARAICAEMHSSFQTLRALCGMNIEADLQEVGQSLWNEHPQLQADVKRIQQIWADRPHANSFLSGDHFTIADAFYAPVVMRFVTYGLSVSDNAKQYMNTILAVPAVKKWIDAAKKEHLFLASQERYRTAPADASTL